MQNLPATLIPPRRAEAAPEYDPIYDLNTDGIIDMLDYSLFFSVYGANKWNPATWTELAQRADFDGNGVVDIVDFTRWQSHYGAVKPEPPEEPQPPPVIVKASLMPALVIGGIFGLMAIIAKVRK